MQFLYEELYEFDIEKLMLEELLIHIFLDMKHNI